MFCFSGRSAGHNPAKNPAKGGVHLTALPDDLTPAGFAKTNSNVVKFRLETFNRGNGYVGLEAVKDKRWMERLFIALDQAWKNGRDGLLRRVLARFSTCGQKRPVQPF